MPGTVRAARTIMCVQLVLTLLLTVILMLGLSQLGWNGTLLLILLNGIVSIGVTGLVVFKMGTRGKWVRWTGLGIQGLSVIGSVMGGFSGVSAGQLVGLVLPVAVIVLLLTPPSAAWFDA